MERKVIVIVGPTCTGKTSLGIKIAARLKSEILSADSRQVYKYLTIGTAKPEHEDLKKVHHYFIDDLEPNQDY
ncbi:MAG: tRNA (adenosine(37)-N6)-dimethylallyltransferase MiaA, partial [Melioribacteraceae bacterium]|nr:tRNA (adenosine(37)-N6)-dimethylallyltransferase MiaA [Melioribacteraceae bacterium]